MHNVIPQTNTAELVNVPSRLPDITEPDGQRCWRTGPSRWVILDLKVKGQPRPRAYELADKVAIARLDAQHAGPAKPPEPSTKLKNH